jgi:thiol:disulfide interchange protein
MQHMKKALSISFLLLFVTGLFAGDGIQFNQGSWKEVLAQAKRENKLIFIDVYTSWCGPCKKMAAEVFPLKEVGNLFNTSFVNYKMNAEKGEGIALAKQFGVSAYPTYLFVNGDGALIYRTGSYMPGNAFLQEAAIALKEKDDPKPIVKWETEYNFGNR